MIKKIIKTAIVNLMKNRVYSSISIISLTFGLAVCILLFVYVAHELSFDKYHKNANQIYRLCQENHPFQAPHAAKLIADNFPEINSYSRILPRNNVPFQYNNLRFKEEEIAFADAELFKVFTFNFLNGSPENSLQQPATVVITDKIAHKYFGDENPVGKVLKVGNEYDYTVMGVIEEMPGNSHFRYDIFLTLTDANSIFGAEWMNNWGWLNFLVYFQMYDGFSKPELESKISQLINSSQKIEDPAPKYTLQSLKNIHLYSSHIKNDIQPQNSISYVLIFSAIGVLILLIACFNYINLLTATATNRTTEMGVKKVFGASRKQLVVQFFSESFLVLVLSLCLSMVVLAILLPLFNELSGKELSLSILTSKNVALGVLGMVFSIGILAGWYPALLLSSFNPSQIIKSSITSDGNKFHFRKILIIVQFIIVVALVSGAIIMFRQVNFIQQKDLGFEKEYILVSDIDDFGAEEKYQALKQALLNQSKVLSVAISSRVPSDRLSDMGAALAKGQSEIVHISYVHSDFDYFETLGINAMQGRLFSESYNTDVTESVILNEEAIKILGITGDPIGQTIKCSWPKSERKIVGVVKNFHFESLTNQIKPTVFVMNFQECGQLLVKLKPSNGINTINSITEVCQKFYPEQIFQFRFLDEQIESLYQSDIKTFHLMSYFTALAIILACLGLFGITTYMMNVRIKEIGIRKVNGAKISEILTMLNRDFVKWVAIAFVVACPIAYYAMNKWLENFAYKTTLSWWIFALAGILALGIALLTVSWQSWSAATRNPVEALRYE